MALAKVIELELCEPFDRGISVSTLIDDGELVTFLLGQDVIGLPNSNPGTRVETIRLELDYIRASELRDKLDKAICDIEKIYPKEVLVNNTKETYHTLFT